MKKGIHVINTFLFIIYYSTPVPPLQQEDIFSNISLPPTPSYQYWMYLNPGEPYYFLSRYRDNTVWAIAKGRLNRKVFSTVSSRISPPFSMIR